MPLIPPGEDPSDWLTPAEIATEYNIAVESVRRWIRSGRLPAIRPGPRRFIIRRADVLELMDSRRTTPGPAPSRRTREARTRRLMVRPPMTTGRVTVDPSDTAAR